MITPMRQITLLCLEDDAGGLVDTLQEAGVVHLNTGRTLNEEMEAQSRLLRENQQVMQKLSALPPVDHPPTEDAPADIVSHVLRRLRVIEDAKAVDARLIKEQKQWEPFGEIDTRKLDELEDAGIQVFFCRDPGGPVELPPGFIWIPASPGYGVAIAIDPRENPGLPLLNMPVRGPRVLRQRRERLADLIRRHQEALHRRRADLPRLQAFQEELTDLFSWEQARFGMKEEGELTWISGFVPAELLGEIEALAAQAGAACLSREPLPEDPAPTLLRQNRVVSWIQPIYNFLGVTPGYHEMDIGWSFLLFLSIFSGIILGDAGYGALMLLGVGALNLFKPATRGKFANLLLCMGGATLVWGLLSGNIFGIDPAPLPALVPALADSEGVMALCFILGALHLSLAHGWNLLRKIRSLQALAELGWIGSTWSMFFITNQMVLNQPAPEWMPILFTVSAVMIVLFMTPPKAFKEEWVQHMMLPLSFVNNFVDVVSYVRLYAVGMAGFALANSFNNMILGGGEGRGWIASGVMFLVLILMHGLNFILAGLGVMVHGIRLNTLEFSSHIGLTWSGIPYAPFRRQRKPL